MKKLALALSLPLAVSLFAACDDGTPDGDADGDSDTDGDTDGDGDADADADAADGDTGDGGPPPGLCEELGLPVRPYVEAEYSEELYAEAEDFTVPTESGDWTLSEAWTGCEVYVIIPDIPAQTRGSPTPLWSRDLGLLLIRSAQNVHYFFASYESNEGARDEAFDLLRDQLEQIYEHMPPDERAHWQDHLHFVTDDALSLTGWVGMVLGRPGFGIGIDRFQRIRYIGSFGDPARYDGSTGTFGTNLSLAANEAVYYNFEAERRARLDEDGATVIPIFEGEVLSDPGWDGVRGSAEVELPEAAEMSTYDTLELDLYLGCDGEGELGTCPAWDYLVHLYLCDEDEPDSCSTELGRWITTYHREGRWVHDVSGLLPLIASGGTRRLEFYTEQPYEVALSLRLSHQGREARAEQATYLFSGGGFDADYNVGREPAVVGVPADAARVEIATVISGHGGAMPGNCAEFCDTTHHFRVNGHETTRSFDEVGDTLGCMDRVSEGVVPNQFGTWWFGRSGWCPGLEVPVVMLDVTDHVVLGGDNVIEYEGLFLGEPYPAGGANIRMTSWLVVSR